MKDIEKEILIEEITSKVVENVLLRMPEVIGSLIQTHAMAHQINKKFKTEHPEFANYMPVVKRIIQEEEKKYPDLDYEKLLNQSIPLIKNRIEQTNTAKISGSKNQFGVTDNGVL